MGVTEARGRFLGDYCELKDLTKNYSIMKSQRRLVTVFRRKTLTRQFWNKGWQFNPCLCFIVMIKRSETLLHDHWITEGCIWGQKWREKMSAVHFYSSFFRGRVVLNLRHLLNRNSDIYGDFRWHWREIRSCCFQAVCCNDHEHCCPKGYKCNVAEQTCEQPGGLSLPWLQKIPALQKELSQAVSGPTQPAKNMCDAQTSCPKDTTCCFMDRTQKWGCCPLPKVSDY